MSNNSSSDTAFVAKLTCSDSNQSEDMLILRKHVTVIADGDCFINFDKAVTSIGRFYIKANLVYKFDVSFSRLNYLADSGTPALYITANR